MAVHPSPLPEERESAGTAQEDSQVAVAVPASLSFVSEAHDNQARSSYRSTAECVSLSLGERVGVRASVLHNRIVSAYSAMKMNSHLLFTKPDMTRHAPETSGATNDAAGE